MDSLLRHNTKTCIDHRLCYNINIYICIIIIIIIIVIIVMKSSFDRDNNNCRYVIQRIAGFVGTYAKLSSGKMCRVYGGFSFSR